MEREEKWEEQKRGDKDKKGRKKALKMQHFTYKTKKKFCRGLRPPAPPTNNSSGVLNPPALTQNKILMAFTPLHLP